MRVVLLLISFILSYYNFLAEGNKEPNGMLLNNPEKSIKGILIDTPSKVPGCGIFCNVVACRFKESITKKTFILFIPCPEMYGENFFKRNRLYEAHLLPDGNKYKDCLKVNRFQGQKAPSYYVDDIKKVEDKTR